MQWWCSARMEHGDERDMYLRYDSGSDSTDNTCLMGTVWRFLRRFADRLAAPSRVRVGSRLLTARGRCTCRCFKLHSWILTVISARFHCWCVTHVRSVCLTPLQSPCCTNLWLLAGFPLYLSLCALVKSTRCESNGMRDKKHNVSISISI